MSLTLRHAADPFGLDKGLILRFAGDFMFSSSLLKLLHLQLCKLLSLLIGSKNEHCLIQLLFQA